MKCNHIKPDGEQCGAYAMTESDFCYLHNPDIPEEEKKKNQTKGGSNRAVTVKDPLPVMPLKTPVDAVNLLADTIHRVREGEIDIRVANCIGVLSGHLIKAFEVANINEKVDVIEQVIMKRQSRRGR